MKPVTFSIGTFAAVLFAVTQTRAVETYNIDPAHGYVGFTVAHLVISTVKGKFNEFSGTVVLEDKTIKEAKGTIETKSLDSGNADRDKHVRSADFLDTEKYPTITFVSKRSEKKGEETVLTADFTVHGVTKEITLPLKVTGPLKDPWGNTRIGLAGKIKINRKDYGIRYDKTMETGGLLVGEEVELEISAEATKAK